MVGILSIASDERGLSGIGGAPEARDKRVQLAAQADAEGRVQEGGHQRGRAWR